MWRNKNEKSMRFVKTLGVTCEHKIILKEVVCFETGLIRSWHLIVDVLLEEHENKKSPTYLYNR